MHSERPLLCKGHTFRLPREVFPGRGNGGDPLQGGRDDAEEQEQEQGEGCQFEVLRVLRHSEECGDVVLLAHLCPPPQRGREESGSGDPQRAIVVLKPKESGLHESVVASILCQETSFTLEEQNSVFYYLGAKVSLPVPLAIKLIFPATDTEISFWASQQRHLIRETAEEYKAVTLPYIQRIPPERNQWIDNMFRSVAASASSSSELPPQTIFFEDEHFLFISDAKWDGASVDRLHCLALVKEKELYTIRELCQQHIPMLQNIRDKGLAFLHAHFHLPPSQVKVYIHHLPSFFHLHVHFTCLRAANNNPLESPVERAHLLPSCGQ
ncbi:DCPS diphosphatase [Balamuthia mandrillaris]